MEEVTIILLLKNTAGVLERELGTYTIADIGQALVKIFAVDKNEGIKVFLELSTARDVEDWEFNAILDYYDCEILGAVECGDCFNPTWRCELEFSEDENELAGRINTILYAHMKEIEEVMSVIVDKQDDYEI